MTAGHEDARGAGRAGRDGQHGECGGNGENGERGEQRGNGENGEHGQRRRHGEHGEQRGSGGYREHGDHREHEENDGMDALMAAITGDPPPEEARRDPAFLAEHRAAEADVAVLRDHLARLAEALTGEASTEEAAEASPDAVSALPPAPRPRGRTRPSAATRPARPPRPGRAGGPRRTLRIALGSLAGAAAFSLVLGFGWLVVQGGGAGGADDKSGASSAAKGNVDATGEEAGAGGRPAHPERELACSRLVVEGTVARVEPDEDAPGSRVTLTVVRSYRPAHGPAEVRFLLGADARPAPRSGQHVLVRVGRGERYASLWAVGDRRVAAERAWITEALPGSRTLACSSADGS
ncbi:hypothetical protein GCM10010300_03940 [Streptomyces olivaceoviridis]|uniref:hypothetical protein n=1 Tax=Streptomyces olivaceoviridis TaxID=1921 RepID=UPI001679019A|nr:hypothetical protein [Streptomyces olivaceoviridis]GGY64009.1 hypothetical protein GCM10010300_03940 [Streptomyces olivaceoviridis]